MSECPEEFKKVIIDFTNDIKMTFPEYAMIINKYFYGEVRLESNNSKINEEIYEKTFIFCKSKYSPRFFDILYQNTEIFDEESSVDTEFIPNIYFKNLWNCGISEKTKETIWKYLQLILFSAVGKIDDKEEFGETLKLFEAINDDEFKTKLDDTFEGIKNMFEKTKDMSGGEEFEIPNPEDMHDHISGLLKGKLGSLATEIAEDITGDLNIDPENTENMNDLFSNMIKDPSKLMGIVNKVTNKLEGKIKSGDIKESELLSEATEMMQQMKGMPGMENMQSLFSKMGMDMFGGKVDTKATEEQLKRKMKLAKTKERIRAKAEANEKAKQMNSLAQMAQVQQHKKQEEEYMKNKISDDELVNIFSSEPDEKCKSGAEVSKKAKGKKKGKKTNGK